MLNGDLKNLLEDSNYDLTTMVIEYSIPITFSILSSNPTIPSTKHLFYQVVEQSLFHNLFW